MEGDAMFTPARVTLAAIVASILAALVFGAGGPALHIAMAQPAVPPPPLLPGFYVQVPHGAGYVYVPLDPSGWPLAPSGAPAAPSGPPLPAVPAVPAVPSQPPSGTWGYLRTEIDPGDASVSIDGRGLGAAGRLADSQQFLALTPGFHQIEIARPGFKSAKAVVEIASGRSYLLRLKLVSEPEGPAASPGGRGSEEWTSGGTPPGGGYFIVPRR